MANERCGLDGCDKPAVRNGRTICEMHYYRLRRYGDYTATKHIRGDDAARFWSKVKRSDGCWELLGALDTGGYGIFRFDGKIRKAHRVALILSEVEILEGLDVDHICRNRACVRPDHLRSATRKQNVENHSGAQRNNTTKVRGVTWNKARKKYMARVGHNDVRLYLGLFNSIEEANAAVVAKRNELYTHNDADRVTNS